MSLSSHRMVGPLLAVAAGIMAAHFDAKSLAMGLVLAAVAKWLALPARTGRVLSLACLLFLVAFWSSRLGARELPSEGPTLCVGRVTDAGLLGRCQRTDGHWQRSSVALSPPLPEAQGRTLAAIGTVALPQAPRNPGQPDDRAILRARGLDARLHLDRPPVLIETGTGISLRLRFLRYGRRRLGALDRTGIVAAMVLGDRAGVAASVRDAFRRAGMSHLLAISGFHMGIVGWGLFVLLKGILARSHLAPGVASSWRALITLGVVGAYAWLTGGAASTIRAASMAGLLLGRALVGRPSGDIRHTLYLAAIVYLLWQPDALLGPGLVLSFVAVWGLLSDAEHGLVTATVVAVLFTAPVSVFFFGTVAWVGLFSNLLAGPLSALVVVGGVVTLLMPGPVGALTGAAAGFLAEILVFLADWFGHVRPISLPGGGAAFLVLALAAGRIPRHKVGRRWITSLLMVLVVAIALYPVRRPLRVTFLDVGQGDAAFIETPAGKTLLIDAGPPAAGWALAGALGKPPDMVLLTHDHLDHTGGLSRLLTEGKPDSVLVAAPTKVSRFRAMGIAASDRLQAGSWIELDREVRLLILAPEPAIGSDTTQRSKNESSVVLLLRHGKVSFLLTGDAEFQTERYLAGQWGRLLEAHVVKIPHHGSDSSSHPFLISRTTPPGENRFAVVQVGADNRFNLPDAEPLSRWIGAGYTVFSTALDGAVTCTSNGKAVHCGPFSPH